MTAMRRRRRSVAPGDSTDAHHRSILRLAPARSHRAAPRSSPRAAPICEEKTMRRHLLWLIAAIVAAWPSASTLAQTGAAQTGVALTGQVSAEEGAMEGVLVSAKKAGSTITITVLSDSQGRYSFPAGRLEPGQYALSIRA